MDSVRALGAWLKVSTAAMLCGGSASTIRHWEQEGHLICRRTIGNHRLISRDSLIRLAGLDIDDESSAEQEDGDRQFCLYERVSSKGQDLRGSTRRQHQRMLQWIKEKYNKKEHEILVIRDIASAFGPRRGLQKMIDLIIANKINTVCSEFQDRLSRVSSELLLIQHIATKYDVEIVFAKENIEDEGEQKDLITELTDFIVYITNTIAGRKSAEVTRVPVPEKLMDRIHLLHSQGHSLTSIVQMVRDEGHRDTNGRYYSYHVLHTNLEKRVKSARISAEQEPARNLIEEFVEKCCVVSRGDAGTYQLSFQLYAAFEKHCRRNRVKNIPSKRSFGNKLKQMGFIPYFETKKTFSGYSTFRGLCLRES